MGKRDFLFVGLCLVGLGLVGAGLFRRQRIKTPKDFQPQRVTLASLTSSPESAAATPSIAGTQSATRFIPNSETSLGEVVAHLNAEFATKWQAEKLTPADHANDLALARRVSLALMGTVPSLEEIRALEQVPAKDRAEWWLSHVLEDARYADYFSERLARAYVGTEDGPFLFFRRHRFRTWLAEQLTMQTPYDEIVRKMIADNGQWTGNPAVNFTTAAVRNNEENRIDEIRLAGRTTRAFLGMRIDCLQCHDDKLGRINLADGDKTVEGKQTHFHELAAFFGDAKVSLRGIQNIPEPYNYKYLHAETETNVTPRVPFGQEIFSGDGSPREQLANWVTNPRNKPFARATVNRIWALVTGRPLVQPLDDISLTGPYPAGLELLADDFIAHRYDLRRLIRIIASTEVFQLDSAANFDVTPSHEQHWAVFPITRLRPEQMAGSLIQASSLTTIDQSATIISKLDMFGNTNEFVKRYGDIGEDEFNDRAGTIPQRLLLMNGYIVQERIKQSPFQNAATRIAGLTPKNDMAVEAAFLAVLTRHPTPDELTHFSERLTDLKDRNRAMAVEDLYWVLINSTEFSWNH